MGVIAANIGALTSLFYSDFRDVQHVSTVAAGIASAGPPLSVRAEGGSGCDDRTTAAAAVITAAAAAATTAAAPAQAGV